MKYCWFKPSSQSTSVHQTAIPRQRQSPQLKKKITLRRSTCRSNLSGNPLFTSSPSCNCTKTRLQPESLKKLFLVETPPRRRQARCQKNTKSRKKLFLSTKSSTTTHGFPAVVSAKRTTYGLPDVASFRRSLTGQAPVVPLSDDSTVELMEIDMVTPLTHCSEAEMEDEGKLELANRNSVNFDEATSESSQRLNHLADLRREAYRDLALSTQTYNDALVRRMRHLESLSWEDQRSWVQSRGDINTLVGMDSADICGLDGELNRKDVITGDADVDVDELIELMEGDGGNVKDYEELLEFERGVMKHDVNEANWIGDLW